VRVVRVEVAGERSYGAIEGDQVRLWSAAPWAGGGAGTRVVKLGDCRLLAPCEPTKVIGVAINFPGATDAPNNMTEPLVFLKPGSSIIGPNDVITSPFPGTRVWGESELGVVIGARARHCTPEEASAAVFGYTIGNDVSCDNVHGWDHHLARSKAADTFCAIGPWIDTEFQPSSKAIRGYHNHVLLREGFANARVWAEPGLVAWLSQWISLEPGDVILTGAPTRVRDRQFLHVGDVYTCAVEGLGELANSFTEIG
jgi:2-keto-4-pentenoate hydratase/2-oxohepta-3-ene-1,7-dioic acid hydratase in catechol pathway